jgi:hypothetical protein
MYLFICLPSVLFLRFWRSFCLVWFHCMLPPTSQKSHGGTETHDSAVQVCALQLGRHWLITKSLQIICLKRPLSYESPMLMLVEEDNNDCRGRHLRWPVFAPWWEESVPLSRIMRQKHTNFKFSTGHVVVPSVHNENTCSAVSSRGSRCRHLVACPWCIYRIGSSLYIWLIVRSVDHIHGDYSHWFLSYWP